MFQHILVPTDFSRDSGRALDIAVNIVSRDSGEISLLHVIETIAHTTFEEFEDFYTTLGEKARDSMDALVDQYQDRGIPIDPKIVYGQRVEQILSIAADLNVDLIVMNSHKIDLQTPSAGWGTISYKVGILSQCPVMLVK